MATARLLLSRGRRVAPAVTSGEPGDQWGSAGAGPDHEAPLRRSFSWLLAGNVSYSACQWGMLVSLAQLGSVGQVGQFGLALAITAPVMLFCGLQLAGVQASDARRDFAFGHYLGLRLMTTSLGLLVIAGICLVSRLDHETALVVLAVACVKALDAISDVSFGLLQNREAMRAIGLAQACNGVMSLSLLTVVMSQTHNVLAAVAASAGGSALAMAGIALPAAGRQVAQQGTPWWRGLQPSRDLKGLVPLVRLALPLGVVMLLVSLTGNAPRYAVQRFLGSDELGVYVAMTYITVAGATVVAALGQASVPRLSRAFARGDLDAFRGLLRRLLSAALVMALLGIALAAAVGQPLLRLVYGPAYAARPALFVGVVAVAGLTFCGAFLGYGMTAARQFGAQAPLYAGVLVVTVVLCLASVPRWGLAGAVWSAAAGTVVQLCAGGWVLRRALHRRAKEARR